MNITKCVIVGGSGPDKCFLYTDLPESTWPFQGNLALRFDAAAGSGAEYVKRHFGLDAEIIKD